MGVQSCALQIGRSAAVQTACVVACYLWTAPSDYARVLKRLQQRRCAETGQRLWKTAEVDHRVPLFRVGREHRDRPGAELLGFWGLPNLQVINRDGHVSKCATEAGTRRKAVTPPLLTEASPPAGP